MTTLSRRIIPSLLLGALLAAATETSACPKKDDRKVRVSVLVILASETDAKVEKKLECIAREVRKMYPKLKGFRSGNLACRSVKVGTADRFAVIEGQTIEVTVQRAADKMDRIRLKVAPPSMGEITYSTPCGKFLPILTPYQTKNNETVLVAIRVQPCNGK
jgi:hypothetical protein